MSLQERTSWAAHDELPGNEGVVQAGDVETRYRRAGQGPAVLLLGTHELGDARHAALFLALARAFRVTRPQPFPVDRPRGARAPTRPVSAWLRGLMDGLGLERASIVADDAFGVVALGFATAEPDRVDRLVLLDGDLRDPAIPGAAHEDRLRASGHPLLIVRWGRAGSPDGDAEAGLAAVLRFLGARSGGAQAAAPDR